MTDDDWIMGALAAQDDYQPVERPWIKSDVAQLQSDDLDRMPFGVGSPAESAHAPSGLDQLVRGAYTGLGETAKGAFIESERLRSGEGYNAKPAVEAALMTMGGPLVGVTKGAGEVVLGAGPVRSIEKPTLFDYSRIHEVPDVKQFDLPRYEPKRGVSERVEGLVADKATQDKMMEKIEAGKKMNAETFYYNEPLRQAFIDELGKKNGEKGFARYMDYVAATSPRSDVETNARNASYYYGLEKRGEPVPPQGGKNPEPYGHLAQNLHRMNAEKIRSGEYFDMTKNPKPLSFSQNLQGNFAPVTVDAHALKLPAMLKQDPAFIAGSIKLEKGEKPIYPNKMLASGEITMEDALKRPVFWAGKPNPNEYAAMEQYYKRLAGDAGMAPGQVQAAAWAGGGKLTGLESVAGDPFMRSVENRAIKTAKERGISPAEALSQMMRGKAPLLGLGGAVMGGLAAQDQYHAD